MGTDAAITRMLLDLDAFVGQLAALYELADLSAEHVTKADDEAFERMMQTWARGSVAGLDAERLSAVGQVAQKWFALMANLPREEFGVLLGLPYATNVGAAHYEDARGTLGQLLDTLGEARAPNFILGFLDVLTRMRRGALLNGSILVGAFGVFEVNVRNLLIARAVRLEPAASETHVARFIEARMRGGLASWDQGFLQHFGFSIGHWTPDPVGLQEIVERRHVLVHHAGFVSKRYARKTPNPPPVGQQLETTSEYLRAALDHLTRVGVRLFFETWVVLEPNLRQACGLIVNYEVSKRILETNRWALLAQLCEWLEVVVGTEEGRTAARVNRWLAIKRMRDVAAIQDEVNAWTPVNDTHRLVRMALLDDLDSATALARQLLRTEQISGLDLATWPVFAELREHPAFASLLKPSNGTGESSNDSHPSVIET